MASLLGNNCLEAAYHTRAIELKSLVLSKLWNEDDKFFETMHRDATETVGIREEIGFLPWYFGLPDVDSGYEVAWAQLIDPDGFHAPYGPTTCERRHPGFTAVDTCCRWDGTSWPYATAQTLIAFANLLNEYACQQPDDGHQDGSLPVDESNYFDLLKRFTQTHYKQTPQGEIPWVGESVNPFTGEWTTSTEDYMHSSYTDLVISGLVGLRPRADNVVEVNPLVPADHWDYFALDNVQYHGHELKIVYDRDGTHYGMGQGLSIFVDGQRVAHCSDSKLRRLTANLPEPDDHQTAIHPIEDAIPPGTNVNDLTVTVSNSLGSDPGINAIKNEESTIWSGIDTGQSEDRIQVTFPETRTLRALSIEFTDIRRTTIPDRYEVQYRVSGTWKRIPEQQTIPTTPTKGTNFVVFNEITTDRVRIYCDTGDGMYYDAKASGIVSLNWYADLSGLPVTETFTDYRPDNDVK